MVSGIKSLSSTHEQIVIGWTGPVGKTPSTEEGVTEEEETETVVSPAQAEALTSELEAFDERDGQGRVRNVPVWLDKEVAKGHYEGYCKTSTFDELLFAKARFALGHLLTLFLRGSRSSLAAVPLPSLAGWSVPLLAFLFSEPKADGLILSGCSCLRVPARGPQLQAVLRSQQGLRREGRRRSQAR
jgi:hypothetical protein